MLTVERANKNWFRKKETQQPNKEPKTGKKKLKKKKQTNKQRTCQAHISSGQDPVARHVVSRSGQDLILCA